MLPLRFTAFSVAAALLFGCADGTLPPPTSPNDPSNPAAPEAPLPPPPTLGAPTPAPAITAIAPAGPVEYVCPMHADVVRDAPGTCPICGMTLVARPRSAPAHGEHGGSP
jgi:Heavy metal binding domain